MIQKIIDGINIDTGEVVDENFIPGSAQIEELTDSEKESQELGEIISVLFRGKQWHFNGKRDGVIVYQVNNWHSNVVCPVYVRFEFRGKSLFTHAPIISAGKHIKLSAVVDMDLYIEDYKLNGRGRTIAENRQAYSKYKITHQFQVGTIELATKTAEALQRKMYQIVMLTKTDVMLYSRLDTKVLIGESLIEKVVVEGVDYLITEKGGEKILYLYQSALETKTVEQLAALIHEN